MLGVVGYACETMTKQEKHGMHFDVVGLKKPSNTMGQIIIIEPLVQQVAKLNEEMAEKSAQWEKDRVCRWHAATALPHGKGIACHRL